MSDMPVMLEPKALDCAYSQGRHTLTIGERFTDQLHGGDWEIVGWTGERIYSPSGFGGSPIVVCKPLTNVPPYWQKWVREDGNLEWCADSVAAILARAISHPDRVKE